MLRSFAFALLLVVGCGGGESTPSPEPPRVPTEVGLRIAVDLPDTLRRAAEGWASEHRARIEWVATDAGRLTLAEFDRATFEAAARAGGLEPIDVDAGSFHADVRVDGRSFGVPWRGDLTALVAEDVPATWPALARRGGDVGFDRAAATTAFVALAAAHGWPTEGVVDPEHASAVAGLAFLERLANRAGVADAGGSVLVVRSSHPEARRTGRTVAALPAPTDADSPRVGLDVRVLAVPSDGDHRDLGVELARWLASPARAELLHADPGNGLAMHREATGTGAVAAWLALRDRAVLVPRLDDSDPVGARDALDAAVQAALERRRSPDAALRELRTRRGD